MKKFMNNPETMVKEMCSGLVLAHPELEFVEKYKFIKKKEINQKKVTLISGGGSGHEPAHAGYVGKGMLDCAVCGDIFASPSQIQVYQGIKSSASEKGVLLIIKNYSGDIMNFKNAAEMAREEGYQVEYIKVDDDIAVMDSLYTVGRRGVAGTVLVHKIVGAAAEKGTELHELKEIGQHAADSVRTIGVAYDSCIVPAAGVPTFELMEDEMEYGVGIHGEPGISKEKIVSADELADRMVRQLNDAMKFGDGSEVALMINGFGSTPLQELYILNQSVFKVLRDFDVKVVYNFVGNYMTSIDMEGASVSIMKLDDMLKQYLGEPSEAPGFIVDSKGQLRELKIEAVEASKAYEIGYTYKDEWKNIRDGKITLENMMSMIYIMSEFIIEKEVEYCKLDSYAGDGDFGMSISKGFKQLQKDWGRIITEHQSSLKDFLMECSMIIMEYCGGASGPIWGSAFRAAALNAGDVKAITLKQFSNMMSACVEGIQKTGERSFGRGAVVGDKTLIDALVPYAEKLQECADSEVPIREAFALGSKAAVEGAQKTKDIVARMGRAGVVGERSLGHPDAGAYAIGEILTHIASKMNY